VDEGRDGTGFGSPQPGYSERFRDGRLFSRSAQPPIEPIDVQATECAPEARVSGSLH